MLTRWGTVGEGAKELNKNYEKWIKMALSLTKYKTIKSASYRIASALYSLLQEPILKAHLSFVDTFHTIFFQDHLKWFSKVDNVTTKEGFLSRHIAVHFFCINHDLNEMMKNWKTMSQFLIYK